jgi:hypothetical protein
MAFLRYVLECRDSAVCEAVLPPLHCLACESGSHVTDPEYILAL